MKSILSAMMFVLMVVSIGQMCLAQGTGQPVQGSPQATNQQPQATVIFPNQQLIGNLQNILNQQAQLGQFPGNNPILAGIQRVINSNSGPTPPPIGRSKRSASRRRPLAVEDVL
jgi:hypothetical protein